ncbi:Starch-binding associating with outer membrane [Chitinophaga costaii]|uniref:Starch-binding associating with outer membrane n=1 Tax=Chitinophaga costaii TaxID=1335309 RepID=A0A1C4EGR6_9BACT|nr:RagB/SusD family nutrient uptake outer membrane protein [Chitinophaga costaii]PUZ23835.1 RagB/SusD family nutrient uptake outer membrane protein [Chitinophaga costaii]SCC42777.1 Starch-binding associating with outer membrane [Chitinophaga costaii]
MNSLRIKFPNAGKIIPGIAIISMLCGSTGCQKLIDTPLPSTVVAADQAFANDKAVSAVLNPVYLYMISTSYQLGLNYGLYTDELRPFQTTSMQYNNLYSGIYDETSGGSTLWILWYAQIRTCNLVIEGMKNAPSTIVQKNQWLGQAYFLRAYFYFLLTNSYGEIPIVTSSDASLNKTLSRKPINDVMELIIADLQQAQSLLTDDYYLPSGLVTTQRTLPNKGAATALLARAYLYNDDWTNAEIQSTLLINNSAYHLEPLSQTFLATSKEIILGLAPLGSSYIVNDAITYIIAIGKTPAQAGIYFYLNTFLLNAFEPGDKRFTTWIGVSSVPESGGSPATDYYYYYKYKTNTAQTAPVEYYTLFRLAEQYLIRAEARAHLSKMDGATEDLNTIRSRAGLDATKATTADGLLTAILHERQVEFFGEEGNRFYDLKRTGKLDEVMSVVAPAKGGVWYSYMKYWPIPTNDIIADPNLTQTPGYN